MGVSASVDQSRGNLYKAQEDVTLVITSCDRFDLLEKTLESMHPWIHEFRHKIIVEDSAASPKLFDRLRTSGFRIIENRGRLGQLASIDRAYEQCDTEFIFHCEDDWEFERRPNIEAAFQVLTEGIDGRDDFSVVCFRDVTGTKHSRDGVFKECTIRGSQFRYSFKHDYPFNYFTFNPGMLRASLWRRYGPWKKFANERSIARMMMGKKHPIAREIPSIVTHIGRGRSRSHPSKMKWWLRNKYLRVMG